MAEFKVEEVKVHPDTGVECFQDLCQHNEPSLKVTDGPGAPLFFIPPTDLPNLVRVLLGEEDTDQLINSIHLAMDTYQDAANDLRDAGGEDAEARDQFENRLEALDRIRKKLGDTWEPSS
jgi:hypothetical protein